MPRAKISAPNSAVRESERELAVDHCRARELTSSLSLKSPAFWSEGPAILLRSEAATAGALGLLGDIEPTTAGLGLLGDAEVEAGVWCLFNKTAVSLCFPLPFAFIASPSVFETRGAGLFEGTRGATGGRGRGIDGTRPSGGAE